MRPGFISTKKKVLAVIKLPKEYDWLTQEPAPRMLVEALNLYGTKEFVGGENNPVILAWAKEIHRLYGEDSIPWCGLFIAVVAQRAGKPIPENPLWARDWAKWGNRAFTPKLGDVLVFSRGNSGHVGIYVGEDVRCYHVLGGNQGDCVSIVRIDKARLLSARNLYLTAQPKRCRTVMMSAAGVVSIKES